MKKGGPIRVRRTEAGIALLISIFILLLISVVAMAMLISSGNDSELVGNYRISTTVDYAAFAGLEEARSRFVSNNPNAFSKTWTGFLPPPGGTLPVGTVGYVLNPAPGEGNPLALYPDVEYDNEFGAGSLAKATITTTPSIWNTGPLSTVNGTMSGPLYKWVRINAVSEQSLRVNFDGNPTSTSPVYYDGQHFSNNPTAGPQMLEVSSLAVLPNPDGSRSQKLLQYLVAPGSSSQIPIRSALTLSGSAGNAATFHAPASNASYVVKGDDQDCSGKPTGAEFPAIGVFTAADASPGSSVLNGIQPTVKTNYTGSINPGPDVENISSLLPANLLTPSQLDAFAQSIVQSADAVVPQGSNGTQTAYLSSLNMSPTNLMTVVANGDLDVSNWHGTGYGLLLVTGTFTYDPDTTWNGVILVIGKGNVVNRENGMYQQINGAMFVAKTRDASGNLLPDPNLGGASVVFLDAMQGNGIRYSSCWVQQAIPPTPYRIISFHEITQ